MIAKLAYFKPTSVHALCVHIFRILLHKSHSRKTHILSLARGSHVGRFSSQIWRGAQLQKQLTGASILRGKEGMGSLGLFNSCSLDFLYKSLCPASSSSSSFSFCGPKPWGSDHRLVEEAIGVAQVQNYREKAAYLNFMKLQQWTSLKS